MVAAPKPLDVAPQPAEQRMLIPATWKEYVLMRDLFDGPGLRMTYSKGVLELMSPSREHELWKTNIARFVEMFAHVRGIELYGYGSTTFKKEAAQRGAEPDECYVVGAEMREFPDIVIEVIHSVPLIDKLDVYAEMGIPEVWIFRDGTFRLYALGEAGYGEIKESRRIPGLDFEMLAKFVVRADTPRALREFEREIAG